MPKIFNKPPVLTDEEKRQIVDRNYQYSKRLGGSHAAGKIADEVAEAQRDDTVGRVADMMNWKHGKDFVTLTELIKLVDNLRQALQKAGE